MTSRKNLKRLVRERAAKTGESYSAALRHVRGQPTEETVSDDTKPENLVKCSFCGKTQKEVKKLIAGPGVYICEECIALCNEIIDEEGVVAETPAPPAEPLDPVEVGLRRLNARATLAQRSVDSIAPLVRELRGSGVGWPDIADALEVAEAEARSRYGTGDGSP